MTAMPIRVAVTGGTGFIGYALLETLRTSYLETYTPVAVARETSDLLRLERLLDYPSNSDNVVIADFSNEESLQAAVRDSGVVVHLAAEMDFFPRDGGKTVGGNSSMTRRVVAACKAESSRTGNNIRLIYVSSTEAIGETGVNPASEDAPRKPDSFYGESKGHCEDVVLTARDSLDVVVLRPTGVYGRGERFFFRELMEMAECGLTIVSPSPATGRVMFSHIDDVVSAILLAMEKKCAVGNTYNISPNGATTYFEIMQTLNKAFRRAGPVAAMSPAIGKVLVKAAMPILNFGKRRIFVYHPRSVERMTLHRVYSNAKIKQELGWKPTYEVLSGMRQAALEEIRDGGIQRRQISPLLSGFLTLASTALFVVWRSR